MKDTNYTVPSENLGELQQAGDSIIDTDMIKEYFVSGANCVDGELYMGGGGNPFDNWRDSHRDK